MRRQAGRGVGATDSDVSRLIADRLRAGGLSLREAARRAGVSHSTVSRLLRGRARPTPALLRALAPALGLPEEALLAAAGLPAGGGAAAEPWGVLRTLGLDPAPPELVARVGERLERLREYAGTAEAHAQVREGLARKIAALGARGPVIERLEALARLYLDGGPGPPAARAAAGSAALYFLLPVDAIDDFVWPIGYLDDAVAVALAEAEVRRLRSLETPPPDP